MVLIRTIRLFPDYGAEWPLWEEGLKSPDDYGLSPELNDALRCWVDYWEANFHHLRGWHDGSRRDDWIAQGNEIANRLRDEVGVRFVVEYDETQYA